jgi:hypothetical protein
VQRVKLVIAGVGILALVAVGVYALGRFVARDKCLDAGGTWNGAKGLCIIP